MLEQPSEAVDWPDAELPDHIHTLHTALEEFRREQGFGRAISAPQIGVAKRLVYLNLGAVPFCVINPEITWRSETLFEVWDDCLSVPDCIVRVRRHCSISLNYADEHGHRHRWEKLPEDLSELMQHEIDHLDGVLMTERAIDADSIRPIADRTRLIDEARAVAAKATQNHET